MPNPIRVFRITTDVDRFQYFLTENRGDEELLEMDGTPGAEKWSPPPVFIYMPKHEPGDFFNFGGGILISSPMATEALRYHLQMAGELLPLPYAGETYTLLNVTECIECLDQERTKWQIGRTTGKRVGIRRYSFYPDRFSESDIFKIPHTSKAEILYVEGLKDQEDSFRYAVEAAGLRGLRFEEVWSQS